MTNDTRLVVCQSRQPPEAPHSRITVSYRLHTRSRCAFHLSTCYQRVLTSFATSTNVRVRRFLISSWSIIIYRTSPVIRVFGVFTHAQIDHGGFWDTLSQQLQHGGAQYIERCTFRNKPLSPGDNVILPATFPPLPIQDTPRVEPLIKTNEDDIKIVSG